MKNKSMMRVISVLALSAALCLAPAGVTCAETGSTDDYVYSRQEQDAGEQQTDNSYVYQQGEGTQGEEKETAKEEDEESLQDLALQLLEDNKINIAVLMILLIFLGIVLYKNDKLTATRKR